MSSSVVEMEIDPPPTSHLPPPSSPLLRQCSASLSRLGLSRFVSAEKATLASWIVNIFLLAAKVVIFALSGSKAVLAALADSAVDLASQVVLSLADRYMKRHDERYPVGRSRLEALAVLGCSSIMSMASIEVIQFSAIDVADGTRGDKPAIEFDVTSIVVLGVGTLLKLLLWLLCRAAAAVQACDLLEALAEDHLNDVWSNSAAIVAGALATRFRAVWWLDPGAAIFISVAIIARWASVIWEQARETLASSRPAQLTGRPQVKKVAGHTAPPEFIALVTALATEHSPQLAVDCLRAYHFGSRYNVEMEIVVAPDMTVEVSHDLALSLQHKIEGLIECERCFVHVDYATRDGLEHKVERQLVLSAASDAASWQGSSAIEVNSVVHRGDRVSRVQPQ